MNTDMETWTEPSSDIEIWRQPSPGSETLKLSWGLWPLDSWPLIWPMAPNSACGPAPEPWYKWKLNMNLWVQFSSGAQSCPTLCDPTDCSTPGFPVRYQLPEVAQTHIHWVGDATQPSHPLSSPSPPALSLSQHQGRFQWVSSSHQVVKVLEFQLQHLSFQWTFRTDFLYDWLVWSPCNPRDSQESYPTPHELRMNLNSAQSWKNPDPTPNSIINFELTLDLWPEPLTVGSWVKHQRQLSQRDPDPMAFGLSHDLWPPPLSWTTSPLC